MLLDYQVAVEESRVAIIQGCQQPEDIIFLNLCEAPTPRKNSDCLIPINFFIQKDGSELVKPGNSYLFFVVQVQYY